MNKNECLPLCGEAASGFASLLVIAVLTGPDCSNSTCAQSMVWHGAQNSTQHRLKLRPTALLCPVPQIQCHPKAKDTEQTLEQKEN